MNFGKTLQCLRARAGFSQGELARRSCTSLDTLRNWEQNRSLPRIDAATRLARALGVSLDRLAVENETAGEQTDEAPGNEARGRSRKDTDKQRLFPPEG
jgi:transcriptional regulator with XRE-family HTH domain